MKCEVFYGPKDMRLDEREIPKISAEEVLIKVMACGVCGSDVHIFQGDQGSTSTVPPQVQGHEFSGIVVEIGSAVKNCKVGDRVCVDPADNCNECYYCMSGMMGHCSHMGAVGTNIDGGFSQYCKKTFPKHHDRSVAEEVHMEILEKLHLFPEELRLMFLHLWAVGLRASEVCTLKGDAYDVQGRDAWIKVYQIKMKTYKRIPVPAALYKLMKVFIRKYGITADDYVFQNKNGGAYGYSTFRTRMIRYCGQNNIAGGEYLFQSHAYRHTVATAFYDNGVSVQGVRDYLGHEHEEMTRQYIDYMPKKISKANEEYFSDPGNSLGSGIKRCKRGG